jgi:hypothetical protein
LPTQVSLLTLTLTRGPVSLATMASEPASHLLAVWSGRAGNGYVFILAADTDVWACHNFFWNETCFPDLLEPIKQHLKIIKIRTIHIWTFNI